VAIKQIILPSTGIYQRKVKQVALKSDDPESWKDFFSSLEESDSSRSTNLEDPSALSLLEAEATDFLKEYIESDMGGFTEKIRSEATSAGFDYVVSRYTERATQELDLEFQNGLSEEKKRKFTDNSSTRGEPKTLAKCCFASQLFETVSNMAQTRCNTAPSSRSLLTASCWAGLMSASK
jgi:hypothetical protein